MRAVISVYAIGTCSLKPSYQLTDDRARRGSCGWTGDAANGGRYLSAGGRTGYLRGSAVRRNGSLADGGVSHLLLRVPLPLHHGNPEGRVQKHSGRCLDEARVLSQNGYESG